MTMFLCSSTLAPPVESVSVYVIQDNSSPISASDADLFFPVIFSLSKSNIHIVFVDGVTGEFWMLDKNNFKKPLPRWLSQRQTPIDWDKKIDVITDKNKKALAILSNKDLGKFKAVDKELPGFGKKGIYKEIQIDNMSKVAVIDYGNQWRLIELGLLLRSAGYDAVKAIYNKEKHKNRKDRTKDLELAGMGVEKRVAKEMFTMFAVDIDWRLKP